MSLQKDRPFKIVYVIGQLMVGGTERQLLLLVKHIDKSKFKPYIVCLSEDGPLIPEFELTGIPLYVVGRREKGRLRSLWEVYRIMEQINPDIVHSFGYASRAGIPAAKMAGIRHRVISFRSDPRRWVTFFDRRILDFATFVIENSKYALSIYKQINKGKIPSSKVIYNGIDFESFDIESEQEISKPPIREVPPRVVCSVASLRTAKGIDNLISAFSVVCSQLPDTQLWLIGDGELRPHLERLVHDSGLTNKVVFWGNRRDVPAILRYAKLGVLSSRIEGTPNALLEYMAAGLPVVATNVGGNSEVIIHGKTGLLVPTGDIKALADGILTMLNNSSMAQIYGQAGRKHVGRFFSLKRMVQETELAYLELLQSEAHAYK